MLKQTKFIYLLYLAALMLQLQICACVEFSMSEEIDTPRSRLEKILHKCMTCILLNSLKKQEDKSNMRITDTHCLPMLMNKLNKLRMEDEQKQLRYWHSRQGR